MNQLLKGKSLYDVVVEYSGMMARKKLKSTLGKLRVKAFVLADFQSSFISLFIITSQVHTLEV
jgi:hypothetical protein